MELSGLIKKYGSLPFIADGTDETGAFMLIDEYKIHVRKYDLFIVQGLPVKEMQPLIDYYHRVDH